MLWKTQQVLEKKPEGSESGSLYRRARVDDAQEQYGGESRWWLGVWPYGSFFSSLSHQIFSSEVRWRRRSSCEASVDDEACQCVRRSAQWSGETKAPSCRGSFQELSSLPTCLLSIHIPLYTNVHTLCIHWHSVCGMSLSSCLPLSPSLSFSSLSLFISFSLSSVCQCGQVVCADRSSTCTRLRGTYTPETRTARQSGGTWARIPTATGERDRWLCLLYSPEPPRASVNPRRRKLRTPRDAREGKLYVINHSTDWASALAPQSPSFRNQPLRRCSLRRMGGALIGRL